jgi:hypothetical protein
MKHFDYEFIDGTSVSPPAGQVIIWSRDYKKTPELSGLSKDSGTIADIARAGLPRLAGSFTNESARSALHAGSNKLFDTKGIVSLKDGKSVQRQFRYAAEHLTKQIPEMAGHVEAILGKDFKIFGTRNLLIRFTFQNQVVLPEGATRAPFIHCDQRTDHSYLEKSGLYKDEADATEWNYPLGRAYICRFADPDNLPDDRDATPGFIDLKKCLSSDGVPTPEILEIITPLPTVTPHMYRAALAKQKDEGASNGGRDIAREHLLHDAAKVELQKKGLVILPAYNEVAMTVTDRWGFHWSRSPKTPVHAPFLRVMVQPIAAHLH